MVIVLNGPLGIGKSTLAEALCERIDHCVMLDADHVVATNPAHPDALGHLHATLAPLVEHHRRFGYRHFVIDHLWQTPAELTDLRRSLRAVDGAGDIRCFLLTLPLADNIARIRRRQIARALDEEEFEMETVAAEREALSRHRPGAATHRCRSAGAHHAASGRRARDEGALIAEVLRGRITRHCATRAGLGGADARAGGYSMA